MIRYCDRDNQQVVQGDYDLSNAASETLLEAWARVAQAEHRLEACLQRSKGEAGLADDEGRNGTGWQQQTLLLLATWFLVQETQREKNGISAITLPQMRRGIAMILREAFQCGTMSHRLKERQKRLPRNELARFYPWKRRNRLAPLNLHK